MTGSARLIISGGGNSVKSSQVVSVGTVKVAGRLAEVPPTAYPTQIAVARVRMAGGNCMKQGPDDRHAVA